MCQILLDRVNISTLRDVQPQSHTLSLENKVLMLCFLKISKKTCLIVPPWADSIHYRRRDGEIINGVNLGIYFLYFENLASYCFGFYKVFKRRQD